MSNKYKIQKISKYINKIKITEKQSKLFTDLMMQISALESKTKFIIENHGLKINDVFRNIINFEAAKSEQIEGSKSIWTEYEVDYFRDKEKFDMYKTRKLYNNSNYKGEFLTKHFWSLANISNLHKELLLIDEDVAFDKKVLNKQNRPGYIIQKGDPQNWIGGSKIENADFIPVESELKEEWLIDLFDAVNEKDEITPTKIMLFHPIFEAIHPFADGNGRIGRFLLEKLFEYSYDLKYNIFLFSEYWLIHKSIYIEELKKVTIDNKWNDWFYFFIESLISIVNKRKEQLKQISIIVQTLSNQKKHFNEYDNYFINLFFKYPLVNKKRAIENAKNKFFKGKNENKAYKSFDKIVNLILAKKNYEGDYYYEKLLLIIDPEIKKKI